jgi:hypothetical protein
LKKISTIRRIIGFSAPTLSGMKTGVPVGGDVADGIGFHFNWGDDSQSLRKHITVQAGWRATPGGAT